MDQFILLSKQQLQEVVESALRKVLDEKKQDVPNGEGPLTISQAADYLNLSITTLYRYTSQRRIPHHKPGKNLYFYKAEMDQWLIEHKKLTRKEIENGPCSLQSKKSKPKG